MKTTTALLTVPLVLGLSLGPALLSSAADGDPGTERVSVSTGGVAGNGDSRGVDVSADGTVVVFGSSATNLVPGGTSRFDIYARDRDRGVTELVSLSNDSQPGDSTSLWPSVSSDGSRVAFHSIARNLASGDDNGQADVFVRDRSAGRTILVSAASDGTPADGRSQRAEISADGQHVVFESSATDLVPGVSGGHVYIHHLDTGETELVSQSTGGDPADLAASSPTVSADGRYVVFRTFATNLVDSPTGYLYVRDTVDGTTRTVPESGIQQASDPAISGDGRFVAFNSGFAQYLVDLDRGTRTGIAIENGRKATARVSDDGRYVAFFAQAGSFSFSPYRLYVHDRLSGETVEESRADDGSPIATGTESPDTFGPPGISADGRVVGFWTTDDGVVDADTAGVQDVFVRDRGDLLGPAVTAVTTAPDEPGPQEPFEVTASASDAGRGDAVIASMELSVDGGDWTSMEPVDGAFDSVEESAATTLDGLGSGSFELCVRATDGRGNVTEQPGCTTRVIRSTATPVAVTVTRVAESAGLAGPLRASLFARSWIVPGDGSLPNPGEWDYDTRDDASAQTRQFTPGVIEPFGTHGEQVFTGSGEAIVSIQAGIELAIGGERLIDLDPAASATSLTLRVDLQTGEWTNLDGSVQSPVSCVDSPANRDSDTLPGQLCFSISTLSTSGDWDGDGLLDYWETVGVNMDTDPDIELDLPGWGATPDHKDLFVEYDVEDDAEFDIDVKSGLSQVQLAFRRAPVDAGGTANPDGRPGIRLWIDSPETIRLPGSTAGEFVSTPSVCGVDDGFYRVKRANFDPERRWVFRYALKESDDGQCDRGGQAEIGGNDLVVLNTDARRLDDAGTEIWPGGETFMHELGHTLGLRHGGFENRNHKPNYVSLMNYRYSFALRTSGGVGFLDFAPPLPPPAPGTTVGPRPGLLPDFAEVAAPQGQVLGPDRDHTLRYASLDCERTVIAATDPFELFPSAPGGSQTVSHPGADADLTELPGSCRQAIAGGLPFIQTHEDHDDWSAVRLGFQRSGDLDDGPIEPSDDDDLPTDDEIEELRRLDRTIDLALAATPPGGPVEAGTTLTVPVTISNVGTVHSENPRLTIEGPGIPISVDADPLPPGSQRTVDVPVSAVPAGTLSVDVVVGDDLMIEATPEDNSLSFEVRAVDAADPGGGGDSGDADGDDSGDAGGDDSGDPDPPSGDSGGRDTGIGSQQGGSDHSAGTSSESPGGPDDGTAASAAGGLASTGAAVVPLAAAAVVLVSLGVLVLVAGRRADDVA